MKLGILTFHRAFNYGAFLQAYALLTYLKSFGYEVEFIDYWPSGHENSYKLLFSDGVFRRIRQCVKFIFLYRKKHIRDNKAIKLQKEFLHLSDVVKYRYIQSVNDAQYDAIIYGSDQIWWKSTIRGYEGFDSAYWGEGFEGVRKICYAPSMGIIDLNREDKDFIQQHFKNFYSISVREQKLSSILNDLGYHNAPVVVDPTFLMSKEWWKSQCKPLKHPKHYILLFNLCKSTDTSLAANKLSIITGLPVLEITGGVVPFKYRHCIQMADAFQFLTSIKDADYVVTSSFHGTVFSIIFEKQFYCIGFGKRFDRAVELLKKLGLQDRFLLNSNIESVSEIDYRNVKMSNWIKDSEEYLKTSLKL